jgi:hypothetical protein
LQRQQLSWSRLVGADGWLYRSVLFGLGFRSFHVEFFATEHLLICDLLH